MYDAIGKGVTFIGYFRHVVGIAIYILAECSSGTGRDELFEICNHVMAEGSPRLMIYEFLCVPTLEGLSVHAACLVDISEGVQYYIRVGQLLAGFGMCQKEHMDLLDGP